jgi:hypothetical protein
MNLTYHKWLEFEVTNSYFPEGVSDALKLVPFHETSKVFNNYNILIQKHENRYSFYCGVPDTENFNMAEAFSELDTLDFQLIVEDFIFFNYTEIIPLTAQQVFFFMTSEGSESLQKGKFVSSIDTLVTIQPKRFLFTKVDVHDRLEIKNTSGDAIFTDNSEEINSLIQLDNSPSGVYEIWINDSLHHKIFVTSESISEKTMGILRFDIQQLSAETTQPSKRNLQFKAREVFWQYQIIIPDSRNMDVKKIGILGIQQEVFNGPIEKQVVGGQVARVFTSPSPISLQQTLQTNPELSISYSDKRTNRADTLKIQLPNPSPEQLEKYISPEGENAFSSTTIVYV